MLHGPEGIKPPNRHCAHRCVNATEVNQVLRTYHQCLQTKCQVLKGGFAANMRVR